MKGTYGRMRLDGEVLFFIASLILVGVDSFLHLVNEPGHDMFNGFNGMCGRGVLYLRC